MPLSATCWVKLFAGCSLCIWRISWLHYAPWRHGTQKRTDQLYVRQCICTTRSYQLLMIIMTGLANQSRAKANKITHNSTLQITHSGLTCLHEYAVHFICLMLSIFISILSVFSSTSKYSNCLSISSCNISTPLWSKREHWGHKLLDGDSICSVSWWTEADDRKLSVAKVVGYLDSASPMKLHHWLPPRGVTELLRSSLWRRSHQAD